MESTAPQVQQTQALLAAAKALEDSLDEAISRLDNVDGDELIALRRKRLEELRKAEQDKQRWLRNDHGVYTELTSDMEFFDAGRRSDRLVVQFYNEKTERSQILDKHLQALAGKHLECRFCQLCVLKAPFTVKRLNVRVMPTLVLILHGLTVGYCRGFDDFGGVDDFPTSVVERRLASSGLLNVEEIKDDRPSGRRKSKPIRTGFINNAHSDSE